MNPQEHMSAVLSSDWYKSVGTIQDQIITSTTEFYKLKGYKFIMLPITTGTISSPMGLGSDSLPVKIQLEGVETYLADSMQFLLEFALRIHENGVYYIAPSFRGEKADARHLCQFYHSEAEIVGDLDDVISFSEEYVMYLAEDIKTHHSALIERIAGTTDHIDQMLSYSEKGFPRVTFEDGIMMLKGDAEAIKEIDGYQIINSYGEKKLMEKFGGFLWLTHFNHMTVPFYQAYGTHGAAKCGDLLFGVGETLGAGERHYSGEQVVEALQQHQVPIEEYEWYIDLKNKVQIQTSGFGLGIERFMAWLFRHEDIRDMQMLPRFNGEKIYF